METPIQTLIKSEEDSDFKKAQIAISPPGGGLQFSLMGGSTALNNDVVSHNRRSQGALYYEMYRQHPVVRAAIDKKSSFVVAGGWDFVPSDPLNVVKVEKKNTLNRFLRQSYGKKLLRLTYKDLDIYGESFWLIVRSAAKAKTPMRAVRLNPRFMSPKIKNGLIEGWRYGATSALSKPIEYDSDIILHFELDDPEDETQGISPLHALQRAVAQDIFAMEYNESFFKNSAQTGIIFIVKTSTGDEAKRNREWIEQNYSGPENAHRPLLIEGDVSVEKSVSKLAEMEFLEGREFLRQEIMMVLNMDPDKLGIHKDSNRSISKEADEAFHSEVIWPLQAIVEEEINNKLILSIFGYDDVLFQHREGDPRRKVDQSEQMTKHQSAGRLTINDNRAAMGLAPIEGGDEAYILSPSGIFLVRDLPKLAGGNIGLFNGGLGTTSSGNQNSPNAVDPTPALTASQADAVSQHEPK